MHVFGCDFSGAERPRGLCYAHGIVEQNQLRITEIRDLETHVALCEAIRANPAPWGLDFPFSLPAPAMQALGFEGWTQLITRVSQISRRQFYALLEMHDLSGFEARCKSAGLYCRHTDAAVHSFSPLKRYNPRMPGMIYGGYQVLAALQDAGIPIHPFDSQPLPARARVYEIYPSIVRRAARVPKRSTDLTPFIEGCARLGIGLRLADPQVPSRDAADAVMACAGLAWSLLYDHLEPDWEHRPSVVTQAEWRWRKIEGLIVGPRP